MSVSISYSFNLDTATQVSPRLADLHAFDGIRLFRLSDGNCLAVNPRNRKRAIVRDNTLALFSLCDRFRTLAEHRDAVSGKLASSGLSDGEIMSVLEHLKDAGLMISADRWLEQFPDTPIEPTETADWVLAIITCDRPALLRRLLESAAPYLTDARPARVLLLDDSRRQDNIRANRACWSDWLARCDLPGEYWGRTERGRLCRVLARDFPEQTGTIDWLLAPDAFPDDAFTVGQNRNLALLLSAGQRLLMLDDDCYLDPRHHPLCDDRLRIGSEPVEVVPYVDRDALLQDTRVLELNPFAEHLSLLGLPLRQVCERGGRRWRDTAWLRELDGRILHRLSADSAVRVTSNATLGDPGAGSMEALYSGPPGSNARIAEYLQTRSNDTELERLFWKGPLVHNVNFDGSLMTTTLTGVDNRILMPCVLPVGRYEDAILGKGLVALHPDAMKSTFQWALPHIPEPRRYWQRPAAPANRSTVSHDRMINLLVDHAMKNCRLIGAEARLAYLTAWYRELAAMPDQPLDETMEARYLIDVTNRLSRYKKGFDDKQPRDTPWQQDVSILLEGTARNMNQPLDLSADWRAEFRTLAGRYADALSIWPRLRDWIAQRGHVVTEHPRD